MLKARQSYSCDWNKRTQIRLKCHLKLFHLENTLSVIYCSLRKLFEMYKSACVTVNSRASFAEAPRVQTAQIGPNRVK